MAKVRGIKQQNIRKLIRELRKTFPALAPIRVYLRTPEDPMDFGETSIVFEKKKGAGKRVKHFVITLNPSINYHFMVHILLHEWAHATAWKEGHETVSDHGPEWALDFARIYSEMIG